MPWEQWESEDEDYEWKGDSNWPGLGIEDCYFQFLLLVPGCSIGLLLYLWELLTSPDNFFKSKYRLVLCGLTGSLSITCMNIVCVSVRAIQGSNWDDWTIIEEEVESTRTRAYLILGFGAVSSYFFTIGCLVRFLGFPVF